MTTAVSPSPPADLEAPRTRAGGRMRSLDALRGLAALGTVLWHYQHFAPSSYPYSAALLLFYKEGWRLVDLFFCLSGFVFFMNYEGAIADGRVNFRTFFLLRVSRLYPLHVATLVLVALIQLGLYAHTGSFRIYKVNDLSHFVLNLLMLQYGWLEKTFSFNGPSWSISTEFFLYITFYAVCLTPRRFRLAVLAGLALLGAKMVRHQVDTFVPLINMTFGRGLVGFFLGGLAYRAHLCLQGHAAWRRGAIAVCLAYAVSSIAMVWASEGGLTAAQPFSGDVTILSTALFFALVLLAAELPFAGRLRPLTFLGDISYSVYLLHVPLQLALYLFQSYTRPIDFSRPGPFWAFFVGLLALSAASYRWLELPAMRTLRRVTLGLQPGRRS